MKLSYWYAPRLDDGDCYSIRAKTKREATEQLRKLEASFGESNSCPKFGPIVKVNVEYSNAFDLMSIYTGEGGCWEESKVR